MKVTFVTLVIFLKNTTKRYFCFSLQSEQKQYYRKLKAKKFNNRFKTS